MPSAVEVQTQTNDDLQVCHLLKHKVNGVKKARTYEKTKAALEAERKYAAQNYHPLVRLCHASCSCLS
jgi:hypothetical protein